MILNSEQAKLKKKTFKHTCTIKFENKTLELNRLPRIFSLPEVVFQPPDKLKKNNNNRSGTYELGKRSRNKISNYNSINSIYDDEDGSFCLNTDQCDCADSSFCDLFHKHIIIGDLRIIKKQQQINKTCNKGSKL